MFTATKNNLHMNCVVLLSLWLLIQLCIINPGIPAMENPKLYKGIEYVQLEELPEEQQVRIKESLNRAFFVKILVNGKLHQNCILYKDYSYWFQSVYQENQRHPVSVGASAVELVRQTKR